MKKALFALALVCAAGQAFSVYKLPFERGINIQGLDENEYSPSNWATSIFADDTIYANIKNRGFDHVRLPVDLRRYYDSRTKTLKSNMSTIDTFLANITNTGMYAILDFHRWYSINTTNGTDRVDFLKIWELVAERYQNWSDKLAFELLNEPHTTEGGNLDAANLNVLQNETISIIRRTNPTRWIMAASADWNAPWTLPNLELPTGDNRLGVVCHSYAPMSFTHQGATWDGKPTDQVRWSRTDSSSDGTQSIVKNFLWIEEYQERTGIPVWLNEFGVIVKNNNVDMRDVADWVSYMVEKCKAYGVSWAWWEYHLSMGAWQNGAWVPAVVTNLFPEAKAPEYTAYSDSFAEGDYAKKMTISFPGYAGSSPLANFPVLVKLSSAISEFSYSDFARNHGDDLRFTDESGNLIPHEIDTWNPNGVSTVWVRVPSLSSTTKIFAHYGCATPVSASTSKVWDDDYVGVWHLGESALPLKESSGVSTDFSTQAGPSGIKYGQPGIVGGAVNFVATGKNRMVNAMDHDALDGFTQCTIEAWTYQTNHANFAILSKRYAGSKKASYTLFDNGTNTQFSVFTNSTSKGAKLITSETNVWAHQAYTFNAGFVKGFLDGVQAGSGTQLAVTSIPATTGNLHLGNYNRDGFWSADSRNFPGKIDEVRISKVARSADWLQATHDTVANDDFAAYSFGDVQPAVFAKEVNVAFTGYSGAELADFPVLVRLSTAIPGFSYADFQKANGGDLRFFDATGTLLPHEIDTWDANGVSTAWVKVPTLNASTSITAKYGCANPPAVNPKNVWDADYLGVWHLGAAAGVSTQPDSTANGKDFGINANNSDGVASGADGVVGRSASTGLRTDGKGCFFQSDADKLFVNQTAFTVETWTWQDDHEPDQNPTLRYVLAHSGQNETSYDWRIYENNKGKLVMQFYSLGTLGESDAKIFADDAATRPARAQWNHTAFAWDGSTGQVGLYLGGAQLALAEAVASKNWTGTMNGEKTGFNLGNHRYDNTKSFKGRIDEVRISKVARSAAWIKATHDTIANADFATYAISGGESAAGYAAWIAGKGLSGSDAAFEKKTNGIANGVRYAFDIDPAVSTVGTPIIKVVRDTSGNPAVEARDLATGRDDITFGVLATQDLTDWTSATLVPMEKFAADGLWKPSASKTSGYAYPAKMFFKYSVEAK